MDVSKDERLTRGHCGVRLERDRARKACDELRPHELGRVDQRSSATAKAAHASRPRRNAPAATAKCCGS